MTTPSWQHKVTCVVGTAQIQGWESYEIHNSMLEPASHFSMRLPFNADVWDLVEPDQPIQVLIDNVVVLTGFIDERLVPEDDEAIEIVGRNRYGRMVDESAPSLNYASLTMFDLITKVASPWYPDVVFSNARNRSVLRGRGKKARAAGEPVVLFAKKALGTRIEPGQSRHQVIEDLCAQAGCLVFPAGDGTELIIGTPNYTQEIQFQFFMPSSSSPNSSKSTVLGMGVHESTAERYSHIIVVGSGTGTDANYGATVASRYADAKNNPNTPDGDGLDFSAPKRLIKMLPVNSIAEAQELADREMAKRDAHKLTLTVRSQNHGQTLAGTTPTIFAPDTLAQCEDERTSVKGSFLITSCVYRCSRDRGEETELELVRSGTELIV